MLKIDWNNVIGTVALVMLAAQLPCYILATGAEMEAKRAQQVFIDAAYDASWKIADHSYEPGQSPMDWKLECAEVRAKFGL